MTSSRSKHILAGALCVLLCTSCANSFAATQETQEQTTQQEESKKTQITQEQTILGYATLAGLVATMFSVINLARASEANLPINPKNTMIAAATTFALGGLYMITSSNSDHENSMQQVDKINQKSNVHKETINPSDHAQTCANSFAATQETQKQIAQQEESKSWLSSGKVQIAMGTIALILFRRQVYNHRIFLVQREAVGILSPAQIATFIPMTVSRESFIKLLTSYFELDAWKNWYYFSGNDGIVHSLRWC